LKHDDDRAIDEVGTERGIRNGTEAEQVRRPRWRILAIAVMLIGPLVLAVVPAAQLALAGGSRAPNVIATTLAFDDGKVVTVQYSQIYFCNSPGPATSAASSPCAVGQEATVDPVPDVASSKLEVIVPAFLHPLCDVAHVTCAAETGNLAGSSAVFDPTLGGNNFAQCPDNTVALTCPNHPNFLDLSPLGLGVGVVPLPIHSHIISGQGIPSAQGGWWQLRVWLVLDPTIWPDPKTGACTAGTGCLTSEAALQAASGVGVLGPVPSVVYLFFNVVSPTSR